VLFDGTLAMLEALKGARPPARRGPPASRAAAWTTRSDSSMLRALFDRDAHADETASKPDLAHADRADGEFQVRARTHRDDRRHDHRPGSSRAMPGAASIGVSYGAHDHSLFDGYGARHVAHSTPSCTDWLLRHG